MNVALIEFNPFHDECLYSQVKFLRSRDDIEVYIICNHRLDPRIDYWDLIEDKLLIGSNQWGIGYLRILNFLNKNNIDHIVFNSLHSGQVSTLLSFPSSKKRKHFGLVHDLKNLDTKQFEKDSGKINGYFLLNDYLVERVEQIEPASFKFSSFYPIFFPDFEPIAIEKNKNEIWVTIPGLMEPWRRDYARLLDSFSKGKLDKNIKLLFLGKSSDAKGKKMTLRASFEEADQHGQCLFWDGFVEQATFHSYLRQSDYLLPLLHAGGKVSERYRDKITGLYNLGFGYDKRFIMERMLKEIEDFRSTAIFYDEGDDIISVLNKLEKPSENSIYIEEKFSFDYQAQKYLKFLQS